MLVACAVVGSLRFLGVAGGYWRVVGVGVSCGGFSGLCVVEGAGGVAFAHVTGGAAVGEARGVRFESVYAGGMVGERSIVLLGVLVAARCRLVCLAAVA